VDGTGDSVSDAKAGSSGDRPVQIPSLDLMERAGKGVAEAVLESITSKDAVVAIVVGKGNNGGDGLVAARYLRESGIRVVLFMLARRMNFRPTRRQTGADLRKIPCDRLF
jgi:NAD(P)H-hydrate repair Nnr-like enzyme with NAD(P)H-hydrate epimerase domain